MNIMIKYISELLLVSSIFLCIFQISHSAPIPQDESVHKPYTHGWSDGSNDGIPPGLKQILEKLKKENPELAKTGKLPDPTFEADGVHKDYTYGWHDGSNDGIPPGFKDLLNKALSSNPMLAMQLKDAMAKAMAS